MNIDIILGKTQEHLVPLEGTKYLVHEQMLHDFLRLQHSAQKDGLDLQVASAFRDYDRQLKIWNAKASGEKQLIDDQERPLDYSQLSPTQIVFAILRWSALPGCSRHHWGSDIDIFDGNTQAASDVKLVPSECFNNGPATKLHEWLDVQLSQKKAFGFFRPYVTDHGGISPERWHLSYYPISRRVIDVYTFSVFKRNIIESEIMFKEIILEHADEIFQRYIMGFDLP
jgi:LAS superfamily LD-carboxypeptidase LdcB